MRVSVIAVAAALVGLLLGVGTTVAEFWNAREQFVSVPQDDSPIDRTKLPGGAPKAVVVNGTTYEFGSMERDEKLSHAFLLKNEGTAPLHVSVGHTSCKCTVADLEDSMVAPGKTVEVKLEWEPKGYDDHFQQSAELQTNDPLQPVIRLTIHGRVVQAVRPFPEELNLAGLSANEETTAEVKLYGFVASEPLEITGHELTNTDKPEHFELSIDPLSESDLEGMPGAVNGFSVKLKIKSGLPIGPISQTIRLHTNVRGNETIEIPATITVASDLSFVHARGAKAFNAEKNLLSLGKIPSERGATAHLFLLVKGPYRHETKISVDEVEPADGLKVNLGEPELLADGAVVKYPLTISVPPGADVINRLGGEQGKLGRVFFTTTHPVAKEVRLFVQYAVDQ